MSAFVQSEQAANIARLQRTARTLEQHKEGTDKHTVALAQYNVAFNKLHQQGMRPADILRHAGVDINGYIINGGNDR